MLKTALAPMALLAFVAAMPAAARDILVRDQAGFAAAAAALKPGDTIVLADGEWRDFAARLVGEGTAERPITLTAQHPGKVILTGRSSLAVGGSHLVVSNLVFRNGFASGEEIIATRVGKRWTENLRLTGIVIDRFSNPDRRFEDHWVALYGRNIRVDHSHFEGKANAGAMLVVVREGKMPLDNRVTLDHNYFGPRPVLGSNGGETIRIGTSTESMSDSNSIVEDNVFERCDGEVEIVSVKSGGNVIRRNLFLASQGSVVLRHGNGNLVERNIFLGQGLPHTGGVRVINERQTVRDNYMEGLGGVDFTSAITVMNGVPNSPINRYLPVKDALIERNTIIDAARITLGAGASDERSQAPQSTRFADNLIVNRDGKSPFRAEASLAGITFAGNVAAGDPKVEGVVVERREVKLERAANGLLYPVGATVGAPRDLQPIAREATGVAWYPKPASARVAFGSGATVEVATSAALAAAVANARDGDVIQLQPADYLLAKPLVVKRTLTLHGHSATLRFSAPTSFQLEDGARLQLRDLKLSGAAAPRQPGNAVIRTSAKPMLANYVVDIEDCAFAEMAGAPGFDVIATTPATLAETIRIVDTRFADISGAVLAGHSERGKQGLYNAERVVFQGLETARAATVADLFRGGTDESTYGPQFTMTDSSIADSGAVLLSGVQETVIAGNRFVRSGGVRVTHSVGSPRTEIAHNSFAATPAPVIEELHYTGPARVLLADNRVSQ
jgi:poly(beta-D-mannuronate) lyase